jgi:Flp pilus assembly protein TadD
MRQQPSSPWILDPRRDLAFFVATPLLVVPLVALVQTQLTVAQIGIYVAAFGATGHHLPGLLRAYGDRELLARFKLRFVLSPVLLGLGCVALANTDLGALAVIVLVWGTWHGLAQVFGMVRIYDGKAGSQRPLTVRLDRAMLVAWFFGGLLNSSGRMAGLLETLYAAGVPLLPAPGVAGFTTLWNVGTAAVTLAFLANHAQLWRSGSPASPLKIPTFVSSVGFWWYAMVWIDSPILGVAIFELFHDVQYLAITWVFSRNRVDKGHRMGDFTRFLFRPRAAMIALYVLLALLYGYAFHLPGLVDAGTLHDSLTGLVATSALLHFYYDGFIWKVRERSTRESLGLAGGVAPAPGLMHRGFGHASLWALLVIPLAVMIFWQNAGLAPELERRRNIAAAVPSAETHAKVGDVLLRAGRLPAAIEEYRKAVTLEPESSRAHHLLGLALGRSNQLDEAIEHHELALRYSTGRWQRHEALGVALMEAGRHQLAIEPLQAVVEQRPGHWESVHNLGAALSAAGRDADAIRQFERATELAPNAWQAHDSLGRAYRKVGRQAEAAEQLRRARALRTETPST